MNGRAVAQREHGDIYLKLPENGHLASVIGHSELVLDISRTHTHEGRRTCRPGDSAAKPGTESRPRTFE